MAFIHSILISLHIIIGGFALLVIWVPAFSRKGGRVHVLSGKIYLVAMYIVAVSAVISSLMVLWDPLAIRHAGVSFEESQAASLSARYRNASWFLLMLGVLVFASLRHGRLAIRERYQPGCMRQSSHQVLIALLGALGLLVGLTGLKGQQALLMIFAVVSILAAVSMWRDSRADMSKAAERIKAHIGGLIGSGIGAYTAFFAFGGSRFLSEWLPGQWQIVPWILPTIIGTMITIRAKRPYRKATRARL